jgi:hypothetical protein
MVVNYSVVTEVVGFVLLGIAVYLDYDLRRWSRVAEKRRKLKRRTGGRGESPRQRPAA